MRETLKIARFCMKHIFFWGGGNLFIYVFIYLCIYLFVYLFVYLFIYLFVYLFVYLFIYLSICLLLQTMVTKFELIVFGEFA